MLAIMIQFNFKNYNNKTINQMMGIKIINKLLMRQINFMNINKIKSINMF